LKLNPPESRGRSSSGDRPKEHLSLKRRRKGSQSVISRSRSIVIDFPPRFKHEEKNGYGAAKNLIQPHGGNESKLAKAHLEGSFDDRHRTKELKVKVIFL